MLFKPRHVKMIKSGIKTETRRVWKRPHAKVDGTYPVQVKMYQPRSECPIIKCLDLFQQRLGDMTEEDADKEGGYTLDQFKNVWIDINGYWDDNLVVTVVKFEYVKST